MLNGHQYANEDSNDYVKVRVRRKEDFHFVNVDLELESSESVQPLVVELGENILALYCSDIDEIANLELNLYEIKGDDCYKSYDDEKDLIGGVDIHVNEFCNLIENLSEKSKKIWNKCHRREFDIGFECGNTLKSFNTVIQAETIKRCANLNATIKITVYPHFNFEMRPKKELKKKKLKK